MVFFVPCFRYMEEVIESTFSLLSLHHEHGSASPGTEKALEPIHLLALLDIKATWFKKWMVCIANEKVFLICAKCIFVYTIVLMCCFKVSLSLLFKLYSVSYIFSLS